MLAYQDMVYSTAARLLGGDAQAQDIAQDVFLKAYQNFEQLRVSPTRGGWLKTVATNMSLNYLTRYRKRWRWLSELQPDDDGEERVAIDFAVPDTLLDDIAAQERQRIVEQALGRLPDHQRVPLVLFHFEDLSYPDIARRLGISLAKVKTDIMRARISLARLLVGASTSAAVRSSASAPTPRQAHP